VLPVLNLPPISSPLQKRDGKIWIFDGIRKKYVVLTPEEWVRQHVIQYLIDNGYSKNLIKIETGFSVGELHKRADIICYKNDGEPFLLVECKNPFEKLNEDVAIQISTYNKSVRAKFIMLTNGMKSLYYKTDWETGKISKVDALPSE
jgi:hypothetical protein